MTCGFCEARSVGDSEFVAVVVGVLGKVVVAGVVVGAGMAAAVAIGVGEADECVGVTVRCGVGSSPCGSGGEGLATGCAVWDGVVLNGRDRSGGWGCETACGVLPTSCCGWGSRWLVCGWGWRWRCNCNGA